MESEAKEIEAATTDPLDFDEVYRESRSQVRAIVYRIAGSAELDDLVQEVFVKIWKGLPRFKGGSSLKTWVSRIAVNTALDFCRKRSRFWRSLQVHQEEIKSSYEMDSEPVAVLQAMQELSDWHRSLITLHSFESFDQAKISEILEVPIGSVKSGLHQAKKELKKRLLKKGVNV